MKKHDEVNYCSNAPRRFLWWDWNEACLLHDKAYKLQYKSRQEADIDLRENMRAILPWFLHWIPWVAYLMVRKFGEDHW